MSVKIRQSTFFVALLTAFANGQVGIAESLSAPHQRTQFERVLSGTPAVPKWNSGFLVTWRTETGYSDSSENLSIQDRDGRLLAKYRLWFPDAWMIKIWDAAVSRSGSIAVVGLALNNSGSMSGMLALVSPAPARVKVVQTAPFEGHYVTFAPDNSLWILGYQLGEGRRMTESVPHAMLHHYSSDGVLQAQHLPWPNTECKQQPVGDWAALTASQDRIGVHLPACNMWMEFRPNGERIGSWPWRLEGYDAAKAIFWRPVITPDNRVFCYVSTPKHPSRREAAGLYELNRERGVWELVEDAAAVSGAGIGAGMLGWLAGVDGSSFVFRTGARDLVWLKLMGSGGSDARQ